MKKHFIVWFKDIDKDDRELVGVKGANLGEMTHAGFLIPPGFILTVRAYRSFLEQNKLSEKISKILQETTFDDQTSLQTTSKKIKTLIRKGTLPEQLIKEVFSSYKVLGGVLTDALVAVRSSATAEDLPTASFAGQQQTFLNIKGEANLLVRIKEVWASLFDSHALFYRQTHGYDHLKIGMAIPVQKMIESEKSGVLFTINPVTNDKKIIVIEAIYGLGEFLVQGEITPDQYEVSKTLGTIVNKRITIQTKQLVKKGTENKSVKIAVSKGKLQKITDKEIMQLVHIGKEIETHFYFPQDIEWAIEKGKIYILQARPITTMGENEAMHTNDTEKKRVILSGEPASPGIASGPVRIINNVNEMQYVYPGDILVVHETNQQFLPAMKKAAAVITNTGGKNSHTAVASQEIGIPAIVGTEKATNVLHDSHVVTVNGTNGEIYSGGSQTIHADQTISTATKIYLTLTKPAFTQTTDYKQTDGIGLLDGSLIVNTLGIHPKKLIHEGKRTLFVETLAKELEKFCNVISPRPVIYKISDLTTDAYRRLRGGLDYEPIEQNPLIGFHGAYRYMHEPDMFMMEAEAINYVRNRIGLNNLWVTTPSVRNVEELLHIKQLLADANLHQSRNFKLWMTVEIPSQIILVEKFIAAGIDGILINTNTLPTLMLGIDPTMKRSGLVSNEVDESLLWGYEKIIKTCQKYTIASCVTGNILATHPELVEKLVQWGVTSLSVLPETIATMRSVVRQTEKKILSEKKTL